MVNSTLLASQAQVDAMFDSEGLPDELVGDITLDDLNKMIDEMVTIEIRRFNDGGFTEDESEDAIRSMIGRIALKVGLICMNIAPLPANIEVPLDSDKVVEVFADLMRSGGVTLTLRVN